MMILRLSLADVTKTLQAGTVAKQTLKAEPKKMMNTDPNKKGADKKIDGKKVAEKNNC